jgi:hypothetical protein
VYPIQTLFLIPLVRIYSQHKGGLESSSFFERRNRNTYIFKSTNFQIYSFRERENNIQASLGSNPRTLH